MQMQMQNLNIHGNDFPIQNH